jgi:transketolase
MRTEKKGVKIMAKTNTFSGELDLQHLNLLGALSARELFVEELAKIAAGDERIVITGADVGAMGPIGDFKANYPDRFVDTGVAEANQVGVSAGMALAGKIVYLQGFGPFLALRALDQVHTDVAYQNVKVRFVNTHGGLTSGGGPTHYNIMDLCLMRALPNMTVVAPSDANQCIKVIQASVDWPGPMSIRIARGAEPLVYTTQDYDFEIGKALTAREGKDVTVIAIGSTVAHAVSAANGLEKDGIDVRVIDMHTIRPLDKEAIIKAAKETKNIVTAEDHLIVGGIGSAVAEVIADENLDVNFKRLAIPDNDFPPLGDAYELYEYLGYNHEGIKKAIRKMLK